MKKICVVILNFNGWEDTIKCLKSLEKVKSTNEYKVEVLVIDNASKNESIKKIRKAFPDVNMLENPFNLGFSGGCNEGMRYALDNGADYVLLLNNDTIVDEHFISHMYAAIQDDGIGGVVPKIYFEKGNEYHKNKYKENELGKIIWYAGGIMDWKNLIGHNRGVDEVDHGEYDILEETELATGCCFLLRSDVLKKVGLFDDKFFLYYEDADLNQRIKSAGYKIVYQPKAVIWHKNAGSSGSGSILQDYYISRNRMLFGMRHAPVRTKIALTRESLKILASGREWQKKGIRDYYFGRFNRGSFPI